MTAPIEPGSRCDVGGELFTMEGRTLREQSCLNPPSHRYRGAGMVEGHWGYRCVTHAAWLDAARCTIEPLTGAR